MPTRGCVCSLPALKQLADRKTNVMSDQGNVYFETHDECMMAVADLLANWPLYKKLSFHLKALVQPWQFFPMTLRQYCSSQDCEAVTIWETTPELYPEPLFVKVYKCRHCKTAEVRFNCYVRAQLEQRPALIYKWGQLPVLAELIPKELLRCLGQPDLSFYRQSLRCRNQNMGLASISYLRRVVENKINLILDDIAEEASKYGFAADQLKKLDEAKKSWKFSEKIKYASVILPPSLRPGGHNPIDQLHDLASEGVHYLSDDDSLQLYDGCRPVFEYLFREIDARRKSAADYAGHLAKLATTRKPKV
jgi:hypothetical protein